MARINKIILCMTVYMLCSLSACSEEDELLFSEQQAPETTYMQEPMLSEVAEIMVYVCGAVEKPGVFTLQEGARVVDAIVLAGGMSQQAAVEYLNLAAFLQDGEKLYVPTVEEAASWKENEASTLVNINTAKEDKLCTLPGIGESKAKDIITFREQQGDFTRIEDIMLVPGIKEYVFQKIKDYITVE